MSGDLSTLWTTAGVILGFQASAFLWRINREVAMADSNQRSGLWATDYLNAAAMGVNVAGVFLLPILGVGDTNLAEFSLGLSVLLFAGHAAAFVGHYGFFTPSSPRQRREPNSPASESDPFPLQERIAVYLTVLLAATYFVTAVCRGIA